MNTTHRSIWNAALGAWVAVSEITRACGKRSSAAVALTLIGFSVAAQNVSIDAGANETVPGTHSSPWNLGAGLTVGDTGIGTLTVQAGGTVSNTTGSIATGLGSTGGVTVTGAGATWTNTGTLFVGNRGTATLTVQDGGAVSSSIGFLGGNFDGVGNATVSGAGSTWINGSSLVVGANGTGALTVQDGGAVSNTDGSIGAGSGSTGTATVTGAGATWTSSASLTVGDRGTGTLTVQDGGTVSNTGGDLGLRAGSVGNATVTGAGSTWTNNNGSLQVGSNGTATLTVQDGGTVSNVSAFVGVNAGGIGNVTVAGAGSTWTNSDSLYVGANGNGALTVQAGGAVSNIAGLVGNAAGATGNATVTGAGATWTNTGTLFVGNRGTGTLTVQGGGTVSNTNGFLGVNAGGTGNATVTGVGSTWTSSVRMYVGAAGNGALTVANGGRVSADNGAGVMEVAQLAGSTGVLNIGAAAASAAQAAGTVAAGELRFGAGTGSLNFNHTDAAYVFGTPITGAGVLNHYAGTTLLTGANTYTGPTTVSGGTLRVNGSIANSAVAVNNGGTLGGNGTVGSTTIASGGVLAPGNSIGTLTVNGNVTFAAGSTYRVEVDAAGANDRINATGTATINGGTVDVQAGAGTYAANTQYTILNAAGGRTGNFTGVTSNLAFLTPTLAYDANNVFLSLARNATTFSSVATTPNQIATSTALQNAGNAGDMGTAQTALTGLSAAQARAAYDSASGAGIVALRRAGAGFTASFGSQLQSRLGAQANAASGFANSFTSRPVLVAANDHLSDLMAPVSDSAPQKFSLAGGASSRPSSPDAASKGFWIRGNGGFGNTDSDGNAAASRLRSSGLSVGFDAEVKDGARVGVAATAGTSHLSTDNNESGKTRSAALAVYGSYATGPWNFSGSASLGWGKNHLDRNIVIGALNRVAASEFDSSTLAAYGEASYAIAMNGWTLQPLAGLSFGRNKADGFTETGAGALNLQVAEQTVNSSKAMLGAKASFGTGRIRIEPRVIWAHEFGDLNTPMTAQFQGSATGSPFQVSGATLKRDTLILGLGAAGSISKGIDLFADVQAEHNSAQRNLAVLVGLRSRW